MDANRKEDPANDTIGEIVNIDASSPLEKLATVKKTFKIKVADDQFEIDHPIVMGSEILETAGKLPVEAYILHKKGKGSGWEIVGLSERVDLSEPGTEHFTVTPSMIFHFFVDGEPENTTEAYLTPNQILELAGITPLTDYYLVQITAEGGQISYKDNPNVSIQMTATALKFISAFRGQTQVAY